MSSSEKTKIVFGPRIVPASASCSDAIARIFPIAESIVPAVERMTCGDPSIDAARPISAPESVTAGQGPLNVQTVRPGPVSSGQSVRKP